MDVLAPPAAVLLRMVWWPVSAANVARSIAPSAMAVASIAPAPNLALVIAPLAIAEALIALAANTPEVSEPDAQAVPPALTTLTPIWADDVLTAEPAI